MAEITLAELAEMLGGELIGDGSRLVRGMASIESAGADQVTFLANKRYEKHIASCGAGGVIVSADYDGPCPQTCGMIRCKDAYFAYRQAMVHFCGFRKPHFDGVSPQADIDATAEIADSVNIAAFVTIAAGASVGKGTVIYPGVYVGPHCRIGEDCTIYPNVTLYDGMILHNRVTIHASSSIGHDGFGYATHADNDGVVRHEKIPQAGWVELEDDVEIGACCTIDRATMGATIIGAGTKFSNLVAIGHGTQMGKHCLMVAQAGIAGSVMVGNYCVFAGQAGVVGHISIGDGVRVGAQSGVTNDLPAGQEVLSSPALPLAQARRAMMSFSQLPQLRSAVKRLTREVQHMRKQLGIENRNDDSSTREKS